MRTRGRLDLFTDICDGMTTITFYFVLFRQFGPHQCEDNMDDVWIAVITSMVLIAFSALMGLCMVKCIYMMNNNNPLLPWTLFLEELG